MYNNVKFDSAPSIIYNTMENIYNIGYVSSKVSIFRAVHFRE